MKKLLVLILAMLFFVFILVACEDNSIDEVTEQFKENFSVTLHLSVDNVSVSNKTDVSSAIEAYNALAEEQKQALAEEKALLDTLLSQIETLEVQQREENLAELAIVAEVEGFKIDFVAVLSLSTSSVSISNKSSVLAAKTALSNLSTAAQQRLQTQLNHLNALLVSIGNIAVGFDVDGLLCRTGYALVGSAMPTDWTATKLLENGQTASVNWSEVQVYGFNTSTVGRKIITVSWNGFEQFFDIVVADMIVDASISTETDNIKKTISQGIAAAEDNDVVFVAAGTYIEELIIDKPLTLWGANFDKVGTSHDAAHKTVILPTRSEFFTYNQKVDQIGIFASNVTLKGFTIDGDNPNISSDKGDGTDVSSSIYFYNDQDLTQVVENVVIENNRFLNANKYFINGLNSNYKVAVEHKNLIKNNYMKNCFGYQEQMDAAGTLGGYGQAVVPMWNFHVDIIGNVMESVRVGIQFQNSTPNTQTETNLIQSNTISASRIAIWVNQDDSLGWKISNNTLSASPKSEAIPIGILISSNTQPSFVVEIENNKLSGFFYGIFSGSTKGNAKIVGGSISNCEVAICLANFDGRYTYPQDNYLYVKDVDITKTNRYHVSLEAKENETRLYVDGSTKIDPEKTVTSGNRVYMQILPTSVLYNAVVETAIITKSYFEGIGTQDDPYIVNNQNFTQIGKNPNAFYTQKAAQKIYYTTGEIEIPQNYTTTYALTFDYCDNLSITNNGALSGVTFSGEGCTFTNNASGRLSSTLTMSGADSVAINKGVLANVTMSGENASFSNSGTTAAVTMNKANAVFENAVGGVVTGTVTMSGDDFSWNNNGTTAAASISGQNGILTNNGTMTAVDSSKTVLSSTANANNLSVKLTQNSVLEAKITVAGENCVVENNGTVLGSTTMSGLNAKFVNNGTIASVTVSGGNGSLTNNGESAGLTTSGDKAILINNGVCLAVTINGDNTSFSNDGETTSVTINGENAIFANASNGNIDAAITFVGANLKATNNGKTKGITIKGANTVFTDNGKTHANSTTTNAIVTTATAIGLKLTLGQNCSVIGKIVFNIDDLVFENYGHVDGAVSSSGENCKLTNAAGGIILASVTVSGQNSQFTNHSQILSATISGANSSFVNNGELTTTTLSGANTTFTNNGKITASAVTSNAINASTAAVEVEIILTKTSDIFGKLTISAVEANLTNNGHIEGAIAFGGGDGTFNNSGNVEGLITISGSGDSFANNGNIDGVTITGAGVVFNNASIVSNLVTISAANCIVINNGTMSNSGTYAVQINAAAENLSFDNYQTIHSDTHTAINIAKNVHNLTLTNRQTGVISTGATNGIAMGTGVTGYIVNYGQIDGSVPIPTAVV